MSLGSRPSLRIVSLPKVRDQHLPGIFGDFSDVILARVEQLRATKRAPDQQRAKFFEYLLSLVDKERYRAIQERFLDPKTIDKTSDLVKYLDPIIWFESKYAIAVRLGLDKSAPKRILDLGTGPAHFPVVAAYFGHDVTGTELPGRAKGKSDTGHLYDALCDVYKVKRIAHKITVADDLASLNGPYDLVTSFLTAFNVDEKKRIWTASNWDGFLRRLEESVLTAQGSLFMSLADNKLSPAVWAHLKRRATWAVDQSKTLFFENLSQTHKKPRKKAASIAEPAGGRR